MNDSSLKSGRKERKKGQRKKKKAAISHSPNFHHYSSSTHLCFLSFAPSASNNQVYQPPLFYLCLSISVSSESISCAIHFLPPYLCKSMLCCCALYVPYFISLHSLSSLFDPNLTPSLPPSLPLPPELSPLLNLIDPEGG